MHLLKNSNFALEFPPPANIIVWMRYKTTFCFASQAGLALGLLILRRQALIL